MTSNRGKFTDNRMADDLRRAIFNAVEDLLLWSRNVKVDEDCNIYPGKRFFDRVLREFLNKNTNEIQNEMGRYGSKLPKDIENEIIRGKSSRALDLVNIIISHGEDDNKKSVKNEVEEFTKKMYVLFEEHGASCRLDTSQSPSRFIFCDDNKEQKKSTRKTTRTTGKDTVGKGKVFIGHGHSPVWRELKDFITERLQLTVDEFNRSSAAGMTTVDRLKQMLDSASIALLVMTAEDGQPDGTLRARENVVHEVGLFQGRLGFKKAIIVLEKDCEKFSNIDGLVYIEFPKGEIKGAFEEIRQVFEREGLL